MKIVVTIHEPTPDRAIEAIRAISARHDMVEIRLDAFEVPADFAALRKATAKPIIATNRGGGHVGLSTRRWRRASISSTSSGRDPGSRLDRVVLSHHDFAGDAGYRCSAAQHARVGCAHTKIAATPHNFADNARLLAAIGNGMPRSSAWERAGCTRESSRRSSDRSSSSSASMRNAPRRRDNCR